MQLAQALLLSRFNPDLKGIDNEQASFDSLMLLVAACGGTAARLLPRSGGATTTATTTTTATAEEGRDTTNETVDLADMPQECIDAFVEFLQAIEPVVADFDFENATLDDMEAIGTELEAVSAAPDRRDGEPQLPGRRPAPTRKPSPP